MRETKKRAFTLYIVLILLAAFGSTRALAQESYIYLNGSGAFSFPISKEFRDAYSFGAGVQIGGGISVLNTYLTGRIGYSNFIKKPNNRNGNLHYIPFKMGLRHYIVEEFIFVYGDAGFAIIDSKGMYKSETKFTWGAGAGMKFVENHIEFEVGYQGVNGKKPYAWLSWIEFKLGYNLPL